MTTYIKNPSDRTFKYSASHRPPIPGKEDGHIKLLEIPQSDGTLHNETKLEYISNRSKLDNDEFFKGIGNNYLMENSGVIGDNTEDSSNSSSGGLSHLKWMQNISFLLQDSEGVKLFKDFLEHENTTSYLEFWFACKGLKMVSSFDQKRIMSLAKSIYNKYIKGPECPLKLKATTKQNIMEKFKNRNIEQTTFDDAQSEVEIMMKTRFYPAFLSSDLFSKFVETELEASKQSSGSDSLDRLARCHVNQRLQPLLEEEEFTWPDHTNIKSDLYSNSSSFSRFLPAQYDYSFSNCMHNSYIPVTAVDSELQSLSSDPLTDDTQSYTDSSYDGRDCTANKAAFRKQQRIILRNAKFNRATGLDIPFTSRTEIVVPISNLSETNPVKFAQLLIEKLSQLKEKQDEHEMHVHEREQYMHAILCASVEPDLDAQTILDNHVSNIWHSTGVTPSRSPSQSRSIRCSKGTSLRLHDELQKVPECFNGAKKPQNSSFVSTTAVPLRRFNHSEEWPSILNGHANSVHPSTCVQTILNKNIPHQFLMKGNLKRSAIDTVPHSTFSNNLTSSIPSSAAAAASAVDRNGAILNDVTNDRVMTWINANEKYTVIKGKNSSDTSEKTSHKKYHSGDQSKKGNLRHSKVEQQKPSLLISRTSDPKNKNIFYNDGQHEAVAGESIVVGYYFCDETIPYRITLPGRIITLLQLKQAISKKGNYKYFFKTICHDFDNGVVHEEISNDDAVLPLWEGKIICKIEALQD